MSDTVLLLRYHENKGRLYRSISVLKQRHGWHEQGARALEMTPQGILIGPKLDDIVGLMLDPPLLATFYPTADREDGVRADVQ
jgi:hypothetical protein